MIELGHILIEPQKFRAHIEENNERTENLAEHTKLSQEYFLKLVEEKNVQGVINKFLNVLNVNMSDSVRMAFYEMFINTVTFHDVGKMNPEFQRNVMKNIKELLAIHFEGIGSDHSLISAVCYMDYYNREIKKIEISDDEKSLLYRFTVFNAFVISKHHSNLDNFNLFLNKFELNDDGEPDSKGANIIEALRNTNEMVFCTPFILKTERARSMTKKCNDFQKGLSKEGAIGLYAYMRLLYSLIISSDYYATAEFSKNARIRDFGSINNMAEIKDLYEKTDIIKAIRKYEADDYGFISDLSNETNINVLRSELFLDAEKQLDASKDSNIFYLEAPTGSGKSNTALNLSLSLLKNKDKGKIFYVYPFNTLVEQTIEILTKTFSENKTISDNIVVVNSMTPIKVEDTDELANYYDKALLDRQFLNYPMIVTTHVSLFNIMFGILKGDVSGFYQLCNSVVVLDEIQSYKISIWGEIINFLNVFAQMLNMKVIIMSATLPDLSYFSGGNSKMTMLIKDREKYFLHSCFKNRVKVFYELFDAEDVEDELYLHIKKSVTTNQKVLVEFISTKTAKKFFERFISDEDVNVPVEYLSGEDSTFERKRILDKVKETHSILLIATQVIEAGVDLDMDIGYKDIAKVDSEEQFMGRINRSCLRKDGGMVYFFDLDRAKGIYRNDARIESDFSIRKEKMQQILANKDYGMYYSAIMNIIKMNYGDTVNKDFYTNCVSALMFHEVSEHMKLIEEDTFHVSVFFARDIEELNISGRELWDEYRGLLKDIEMDYAEKQIKLSRVKSKMNMFIYQITKKQKCNINYNDVIGELFYIEEGEKYFEHGKLKREVLDENFDLI